MWTQKPTLIWRGACDPLPTQSTSLQCLHVSTVWHQQSQIFHMYCMSKTMHHERKMRNWTNQSDLPYPLHGKHAFDWLFDCPCYVGGQATYVQSIQVACPITGKQKFKLINQMHCYTVMSLNLGNLIGQFFLFYCQNLIPPPTSPTVWRRPCDAHCIN